MRWVSKGCGSVAANFDYKADSILAAGEYRISVKSKLHDLKSQNQEASAHGREDGSALQGERGGR